VTAAVVAAAGVPLARLLPVFARRSLLVLWTTVLFFGLTLSLIEEVQVPKPVLILATLGAGTLVMLMLVGLVLAARSLLARVASPRHGAILQLFGVAYVLLVWAVWAAGVLDGEPGRIGAAAASFVVVLAFPVLDRWIGRSIDELVGRPAGHDARPGVAAALRWAMRALLAVLLVTAVNELWGFQVFAWQAELRRAVLAASFDLFAAFVVAAAGWQFIRIAIDRRLAAPDASSRLKTLLPLARVLLVAVLIVSTVILVLSGLGVNVGPLLAGAGIVGLAIGFGAQTLVRDIITGAFLILDDAFRVGEYIQSGSYKGTVEAIGLRSVRLRHHRGPIYVVPFGELRGVENLSRDWAIDKITVGVTYDTDIERARKLVKKVGEELAADPELAPDILAPLKMQGLDAFGDFALELRMKITTRPGEKRFVIRRRAYAMIKKAFDANGIRFAYPTVQLAGAAAPAQAAAAAAATRLPALRETA
jgi:small-conductance mechanosensitive channel